MCGNIQAYEELCKKAEMCDKYKAALNGMLNDLVTYLHASELCGIYNDCVVDCIDIIQKHIYGIEKN